ncbi:Phage associated (putative structural protein) [Mycobacteroides abscessus]|nr:Phage associated (putative structural protein) [Mycobacteroides abscessus]
MAHTNVRNTGVWVPKHAGGVFRYPLGTPLPTDPWSPRPVVPGWDPRLGGCDDTGVTWNIKRDKDPKKDWNGDKVRIVQTGKDDTWKLKYIEPKNPRVMEEYFGKANVTVTEATTQHGTLIAAVSNSDVLPHFSYIVDVFDGAVRKRRCIPDAQVSENGDELWQSKDWTALEFTYDLFPDLAGNTFYDYTELDDKLIEATYLVTLAGSPTLAASISWWPGSPPKSPTTPRRPRFKRPCPRCRTSRPQRSPAVLVAPSRSRSPQPVSRRCLSMART